MSYSAHVFSLSDRPGYRPRRGPGFHSRGGGRKEEKERRRWGHEASVSVGVVEEEMLGPAPHND